MEEIRPVRNIALRYNCVSFLTTGSALYLQYSITKYRPDSEILHESSN